MKRKNPDRLAFDRASVRTYSKDGVLHVSISPISKAMICPYYGREIPNSEALGLEPNRIYYLLRDPEELKKAAHTFNNLPLLNEHIPITAADLPKENIVGTTGSEASFESPYLNNSLAVWDASAIAGIESNEQKELSSAYHYRADMTPGEYEGEHHDGVMRDLKGNHVTLVPEGRAGDDVVVFDAIPEEMKQMKKKLNAKNIARRTALSMYLRPRLALDSALDKKDLTGLVITHSSGKALAAAVAKKYGSRLAQDAELKEDEIEKTTDTAADEADDDDKDKPAQDDDEILQTVLSALEGKVNGDVLEKIKTALSGQAQDENPDADPDAPPQDNKDNTDDDKVAKPAMDAAIKTAKAQARKDAVKDFNGIRQAEIDVRPLVGDVVAMDSAEEIYRYALEQEEVDIDGVHPTAYRSLVKMQLENKQAKKPGASVLAMDAKTVTGFAARFPKANKLVRS